MGDYWEYIQDQEEIESYLVRQDTRLVASLVEGEYYEIYRWMPGCRILGWMSKMHSEFKLGTKHFLAKDIYEYPTDRGAYFRLKKAGLLRIINGIVYEITGKESNAQFDVIILTHRDLKSLRKIAKNIIYHAESREEQSFADMLGAIANFISENQKIEELVIHREI